MKMRWKVKERQFRTKASDRAAAELAEGTGHRASNPRATGRPG